MSRHASPRRPGAAPLHRQVLAQARDGVAADAPQRRAAAARRGDPGDRADRRRHRRRADRHRLSRTPPIDVFTPGVLALAVMSTAFTSLAIATGFERRYGVHQAARRLAAAPLRAARRQGRRAAARRGAADRRDLGGRRSLLGWDPRPRRRSARCSPSLLGTAAFASLGLLLAGALRAEATLAAANLIYLLLLAGGAVVLPLVGVRRVRRRRRAGCPPGALGERDARRR